MTTLTGSSPSAIRSNEAELLQHLGASWPTLLVHSIKRRAADDE